MGSSGTPASKIDKDNNISNIGFEKAIDSNLVKSKLEKYDNYVLNAIVNHSLYVYRNKFKNDTSITMNDLINEAVLLHYKKENKIPKKKLYKKVIDDYFKNETYHHKNSVNSAFKRLKYEQDAVAEKFYEMLSDDSKDLYR